MVLPTDERGDVIVRSGDERELAGRKRVEREAAVLVRRRDDGRRRRLAPRAEVDRFHLLEQRSLGRRVAARDRRLELLDAAQHLLPVLGRLELQRHGRVRERSSVGERDHTPAQGRSHVRVGRESRRSRSARGAGRLVGRRLDARSRCTRFVLRSRVLARTLDLCTLLRRPAPQHGGGEDQHGRSDEQLRSHERSGERAREGGGLGPRRATSPTRTACHAPRSPPHSRSSRVRSISSPRESRVRSASGVSPSRRAIAPGARPST
jgi:hypothetical protein